LFNLIGFDERPGGGHQCAGLFLSGLSDLDFLAEQILFVLFLFITFIWLLILFSLLNNEEALIESILTAFLDLVYKLFS
jgi:hypothetical protein